MSAVKIVFSYHVLISLTMPSPLQNYPGAPLSIKIYCQRIILAICVQIECKNKRKLIYAECSGCSGRCAALFPSYIILASRPYLLNCLAQIKRTRNFIMRSHTLVLGLESNVCESVRLGLMEKIGLQSCKELCRFFQASSLIFQKI